MASTLQIKAYNRIRQGLLMGEWGDGVIFSSNQIAKNMGISYTPVREAIVRLISEGLVENVSKVGARVKQLNRGELEEVFDIREAMESKACELAADRMSGEQLQRVDMLLKKQLRFIKQLRDEGFSSFVGDLPEKAAPSDITLHMSILQASNSPRLVKIVTDLHILSQSLQRRFIHPGDTLVRYLAKVYRDHYRILRALKKRDSQMAGEWMRRHIRRAKEYHLAAYDWAHRASNAMTGDQFSDWPSEVLRAFQDVENQKPNSL